MKYMIILAIDTSCDDTSIAVIKGTKNKIEILSNIVSSQEKLHQKYGGVYPSLAKREHQKNLPLVLKRALKKIKLNPTKLKINAIAITTGPGLEPCLWQGINFAEGLAKAWHIPIIPVHHLEAHILVNFKDQKPKLPAIALIVSGGNTQLILIKAIGKYKILGQTRDDAAGECLDKTARILGLLYPGGPEIAKIAKSASKNSKLQINLPRPMIYTKDYDFSFSGLKTAVLYDYKKRSKKIRESKEYIGLMAKEIQQSIIDVLVKKTVTAVKDYKIQSVIIGGGVACNTELRKQLKNKLLLINNQLSFLVPPKNLCADNAAMIGITAFLRQDKILKNTSSLTAQGNQKLKNLL